MFLKIFIGYSSNRPGKRKKQGVDDDSVIIGSLLFSEVALRFIFSSLLYNLEEDLDIISKPGPIVNFVVNIF